MCPPSHRMALITMLSQRWHIAFCGTSLGLLVWVPACLAEAQLSYKPEDDAHGGVQTLDRLLPGIRRSHPGELYDAEGPIFDPSGEPHDHLKWLTPAGGIIWLDVDARTGEVLRTSPGRDKFHEH